VSLGVLVPNRENRFKCDGRLVAATRTTVEPLLVVSLRDPNKCHSGPTNRTRQVLSSVHLLVLSRHDGFMHHATRDRRLDMDQLIRYSHCY
jgi:hypothetical protein